MKRQPRFEIVHSGPGQFHARFRAANGEICWTTETYKRRRTARAAIDLLLIGVDPYFDSGLEVREVDER